MARRPRGKYIDPNNSQIVHVVTRCVRGAFLCGTDKGTKRSFEHRREWIQNRLVFLAGAFGIDCLTFSVMGNHVHIILRSRPEVVRDWSDREVAERWVHLCPHRDGALPEREEIARLAKQRDQIAEIRRRLSDFSWWMRLLTQSIARRANKEDGCTGRFWEGRYKAQLLTDETAILACAMYIDLNPIRAAMADSLENSHYTGAKIRLETLKVNRSRRSSHPSKNVVSNPTKRLEKETRSSWLSPICLRRSPNWTGKAKSVGKVNQPPKGFLHMTEVDYLELTDWTGRQTRSDKRGRIPNNIRPVLEGLEIDGDRWLEINRLFRSLFRKGSGISISLASTNAA